MKALAQRVSRAAVTVAGETVGQIGPGLLVLLGVEDGDDEADADHLCRKIAKLRIFADDAGKMNRSVLETGGAVLLVSQFTLCADLRRGNRPSFAKAAPPEAATALYERLANENSDWPVFREEFLPFARVHRDIIARFGRFPHRNQVLGRRNSHAEEEYLAGDSPTFGQ